MPYPQRRSTEAIEFRGQEVAAVCSGGALLLVTNSRGEWARGDGAGAGPGAAHKGDGSGA
jgi:hypothetical protein